MGGAPAQRRGQNGGGNAMTELERIREAMTAFLKGEGVTALTAWPGEDLERPEGPVTAVSLRACQGGPGVGVAPFHLGAAVGVGIVQVLLCVRLCRGDFIKIPAGERRDALRHAPGVAGGRKIGDQHRCVRGLLRCALRRLMGAFRGGCTAAAGGQTAQQARC